MTSFSQNKDVPPRPFQFGLKALFVATACLGALFATMNLLGPAWSTILLWFLGLVLVHVAANAWGTRGWQRGGEQSVCDNSPFQERQELDEDAALRAARPLAFVPATRLRDSTRLSWKMLAATSSGAVLAGALACGCLICLTSAKIGYVAIAVGGLSAAVVGGFFGFLASSFLEVAGLAWREAVHGRPALPTLETGEDALG